VGDSIHALQMAPMRGWNGSGRLTIPSTDFDSPWKEVLERYLADFLAFFFPQAHAEIDWHRGYTFLDKELQQVARDAVLGRRLAD
jgi:hypothetical protein